MPPSIAIIGAGIAGLACADMLRAHGWKPTIFEKSRGIGGRVATRRSRAGWRFDHGAQYVTARGDAFRRFLDSAVAGGYGAVWRPAGAPEAARDAAQGKGDWYVGVPAMSALAAPLAAGLDIRFDTEVAAVARVGAGWRMHMADGGTAGFDRVVCTAPAPQARRILAACDGFDDALAAVDIAPCWAAIVAFETPVDAGFDVRRNAADRLAWIGRNEARPGRPPGAAWVLHAGAGWSAAHLEADREAIAPLLLDAFRGLVGGSVPAVAYLAAHRWRYAMTQTPLGKPFLASDDATLLAGGDWCLGARVEFAFDSGRAIAAALLDGNRG